MPLSRDPAARRRLAALGAAAVAALVVGVAVGSSAGGGRGEHSGPTEPPALREADALTLRQQVGKLLLAGPVAVRGWVGVGFCRSAATLVGVGWGS